jgi:hypothetical protein
MSLAAVGSTLKRSPNGYKNGARKKVETIQRAWAMPNANTFAIAPIRNLVSHYLADSKISIDPFARNNRWATYTNDLNPNTEADSHLDAEDFLVSLAQRGVRADLVLFDPPYSPRQISECYQSIGRVTTSADTQNAALYARVRNAIPNVLTDDGIVLSFGWNSAGMGKKRGFEIIEVLLVAHGGAHNDTICMAERRVK